MRSFIKNGLLIAILTPLLGSCGGGGLGGGAGSFKTVYVTATSGTVRLESDVLTGNKCPADPTNPGTISTDNVDFTLNSTTYPSTSTTTTVTPLPISIESYKIKFSPFRTYSSASLSTTPPNLNDIDGPITGTIINPGNAVTVPIAVAPEGLKMYLMSHGLVPCSAKVYEYYVTVSFSGIELGTNERRSITSSLNIAFADRE